MRKNSIKNTRINGEVMKELSLIIRQEIKDPSVMGSDEEKKDTIAGLRSAEGYVRRQLAKRLNLRNTPEIQFVLDQSIEYGVHMSRLIDEVNKETPERDEEDDK